MRIVHVAGEVRPFSQTGGLADVLSTLPVALGRAGTENHVVSPMYRHAAVGALGPVVALLDGVLNLPLGRVRWRAHGVDHGECRWWLVELPWLFDRAGFYLDETGSPYPDDALRFGVFGMVAFELARRIGADLLHGHDWQSAGALLRNRDCGVPMASVLTVHNLAFQGRTPLCWLDPLGWHAHHADAEFWGQLNFMKLALRSADRVTTVSPTYAIEMTGPAAGEGLQGVLVHDLKAPVIGIVNGLGSDLPPVEPGMRASARSALHQQFPRRGDGDEIVVGMVGRWTRQKGVDLALSALRACLADDARLRVALLGTGDPDLMDATHELVAEFAGRVFYADAWDEQLAQSIFAGADIFLMPSRFEPCGLAQLRAMRHGTLPVVTPVGGLRDTVIDARRPQGYGFVAESVSEPAVLDALTRAVEARSNQDTWQSLMQCAMTRDLYEWEAAARHYVNLYGHLLATRAADDDE